MTSPLFTLQTNSPATKVVSDLMGNIPRVLTKKLEYKDAAATFLTEEQAEQWYIDNAPVEEIPDLTINDATITFMQKECLRTFLAINRGANLIARNVRKHSYCM